MTEWSPPEEFDDYVIERPLGQGAMGKVYAAQDVVLARPVAVKFVGSDTADASARQRFLLEARATARLQHPNVVAIYRVGELDQQPYIVTELVRGDTLDKLELPLPPDRLLAIGIDLARGLAAAHRRGVIHGDIKPSNAILAEDGGAKLLDFGLATLADAPTSKMSRTIAGTPDYMAPELWRGEAADRRSDVYALGAMLHHLVTGHTVFHDVTMRDLRRVVQERPPPSVSGTAGVAPPLAEAIDRCVAIDPAARWQSGDELREALERCLDKSQVVVLPGGNPYRGLRPFEADHRQLFFGRSAELGVAIDRLRAEPFVLVSGDSGSGKSSLCRAAVLPAIGDGALGDGRVWKRVTLVPGRRPLHALAAALATALDIPEEDADTALRGDVATVRGFLKAQLGTDRGLVIFVDQLEELATLAESGESIAADRALARIGAGSPGVRLLATARADFLGRLAALPDLGDSLTRALLFLRPLGKEEIRDVIVGPAIATGVTFESEALVDTLVEATAGTEGGLPLLQFALAELWTARDAEKNVITAASLESLGGVEGALAKHADQVIAALTPAQQSAVRRVLVRLVTSEGTRARRTETELTRGDPAARASLDALVNGRLLVAHHADDGSAYELAHEVLVRGWTTLRGWLLEDADQNLLRDRVHQAAAEWERLHKSRDALWKKRQLDEAARVRAAELGPGELAFLAASRRALGRRRWAIRAGIAAVPVLIAAIYAGVNIQQQRALRREVDDLRARARVALANAHARVTQADALRAAALALYDKPDIAEAGKQWAKVRAADTEAERQLARASRDFEVALSKDPGRSDVARELGAILLERAIRADRDGRTAVRDDLIERLPLYDRDGALMATWQAPARITLGIAPVTATATLLRYEETGALAADPPRTIPTSGPIELAPGSYIVVASAPGYAPIRYPFVAERGGALEIRFTMPAVADVPPGFVVIPAGRYLFGTTQDELLEYFSTSPRHPRTTAAYLIGQNEVTIAEFVRYLDAISPEERRKHVPRAGEAGGGSGPVALTREANGWRLMIQPVEKLYYARTGEPFRYEGRDWHAVQDWMQFPVTGIGARDAVAYAAWLDQTGQVRGARMGREDEWERAARGADGRLYPHGDRVVGDEANIDTTYGGGNHERRGIVVGPDEVGSHPASRSPFGIDDMIGNAYEFTTSALGGTGYALRGGSFFYDMNTGQIPNRQETIPEIRHVTVGFRVCASLP